MKSLSPSASDIQSHLYDSFINASTYDVAIRVSGRSWKAIYKLHRVVLIQSGFFRSLFTAGFSESHRGTDQISIVFDDFNITRPAFEVCISRLYGGGPPLFVSPNIIPTAKYPLTPPYSGVFHQDHVALGHQPANHRFLLSLLATSIYLSIPSVASQSLSLILKTIGPSTITDYLNFACGTSSVITDPQIADAEPAVGLENIAVLLDDDDINLQLTTHKQFTKPCEMPASISSDGTPEEPRSISDSTSPDSDEQSFEEPLCHYGRISDRIGESCVCWVTRWAVDILQIEIDVDQARPVDSKGSQQHLIIWRRGGLTAKWISAIISADTLFVRNERERYNLAQTVVELRRRVIVDDEENVWKEMFEHGIYYTNMTFEDLNFISHEISPSTGQLYVPLSVLQAAHWKQSLLRWHITNHPSSFTGGTSPPLPKDRELGISLNISDIVSVGQSLAGDRFFPVFIDQSLRIGDTGNNPSPSSMEDLFNSHQLAAKHGRTNVGQEQAIPRGSIISTEDTFFGILTPRLCGQDCVNADGDFVKNRWSLFPPYRFSVEFWDVDLLKEKSRLHSQTVWYAGSLFNVYVQHVRKKGQAQLGIYLHRQSHFDPTPTPSTPANTRKDYQLPNLYSTNNYSSPFHSINGENRSPPSSPNVGFQSQPNDQYRDQRSSVTAYFAIICASATGSSQTRFTSSPDTFSVSQSWGWRSSSLRNEEYLEVEIQSLPNDSVRGKEVSLRATVVIGLV